MGGDRYALKVGMMNLLRKEALMNGRHYIRSVIVFDSNA